MSVGIITSEQLAEYQKAANKYRKELLAMPVIGLEEILPYVTVRAGIRYKETVGTLSVGAHLAPYKTDMKTGKDHVLSFRELETFMGAIDYEFDPNSAATLVIGADADTKGEGMKNADIVKQALVEIAKNMSENLNNVLWSAVRNANGTTTADLFNGWDTITNTEITAGNIAAAKGNFVQLTEAITAENAVDVLKNAFREANQVLKNGKSIMFVSSDIMDAYEDAYSVLHNATAYVKGFEQRFLEGSRGKCEIVPLTSKAGSQFIHLTTKQNMLVGVDQLSDSENVIIEKHSAFTLEYIATMFFGVNFESIDPRRLLVIKLAANADTPAEGEGTDTPAEGGDNTPSEGGDNPPAEGEE